MITSRIQKAIDEFKVRIETEPEWCRQLFDELTVRLMGLKYAYYELNKTYVHDADYDASEASWYSMGLALGLLVEDETSPCVDFDRNHPMAKAGIEMIERWQKIGVKEPKPR